MLGSVVCVFRIGLEGYFSRAEGTFDVETEDLDPEVVFSFYCFFSSIELLSFVYVFAAGVTAPIFCFS